MEIFETEASGQLRGCGLSFRHPQFLITDRPPSQPGTSLLHLMIWGTNGGLMTFHVHVDRPIEHISSECDGHGLWVLFREGPLPPPSGEEIPITKRP